MTTAFEHLTNNESNNVAESFYIKKTKDDLSIEHNDQIINWLKL